MTDSAISLSALRARIAAQAQDGRAADRTIFALGHEAADRFLGGGLKSGEVHEIFAAKASDMHSASGFTAALALRLRAEKRSLLWLRTQEAERRSGALYAPGLAELGLDPSDIFLAVLRSTVDLLRGGADAARCNGLGTVVIECWGNPSSLDLTASRKLALAARDSGVTVLMLRPAALPSPSAADTRWSIRAGASTPLAANAPGLPVFDAELLRRRSGPAGKSWRMEWDRDRQRFAEPPLPGAMVSVPAGRPAADSVPVGEHISA